MAPSSRSAETAANPSGLADRFEIRQLEEKHIPWASAIVTHSNLFCSPLWPVTYPDGQTQRAYDMLKAADYLCRHQVDSGLSYGVFDKEYQYKYPESAKTEGALLWNPADLSADRALLVKQMDFPLVSVALSYDGVKPLDFAKLDSLLVCLPAFATVFSELNKYDPRDPASWKATGPRQVLMRNATSTREDYEGHKIMKKQAHWLMRQAASLGFRGINIECAHSAVNHVWANAPKPFKSHSVSEFNSWEAQEKDEKTGEIKYPFGEGRQRLTRVYVEL